MSRNSLFLRSTGLFVLLAGLLCILSPSAFSAVTTVDTAEILEAGLTYNGDANVTYEPGPGTMTVSTSNGTFPPGDLTLATVLIDPENPSSFFVGDYMDAGINTLVFDVIGSGYLPQVAEVQLRSASGRRWEYNFRNQLNGQANVLAQVIIPLTIEAGWTTDWPGNPHALFAGDLKQVAEVSLRLIPGQPDEFTYLPAQSYIFDTVQVLADDAVSPPLSSLSPLARALTLRFGYGIESEEDLTAAMREVDLDADGMKDYQEVLAEHDAAYAAALLKLKYGPGYPPLVLRWTAVKGQTYHLMGAVSIGPSAPAATMIAEVTPDETGEVQPDLPAIDPNLQYFWLEWEPSGYAP